MRLRKHENAAHAMWREMPSDLRFVLIGLGFGPTDLGELPAAMLARLRREFCNELPQETRP